EVLQPADVIDDREGADVIEEGVDREVAAKGVLFGGPVGIVPVNQMIFGAAPRTIPFAGIGRQRLAPTNDVPRAWERGFGLGREVERRQLTAKRRDLDRLGAELDVRQAEAAADNPAITEQLLDLMRVCGRPDIEVFGPALKQQIPHASADEVCDVVM